MAAFINLHRAQPGCTETRPGNCSTTVVYEHSFVTPNAHCTAPMALRERFGEFINVGRNRVNWTNVPSRVALCEFMNSAMQGYATCRMLVTYLLTSLKTTPWHYGMEGVSLATDDAIAYNVVIILNIRHLIFTRSLYSSLIGAAKVRNNIYQHICWYWM